MKTWECSGAAPALAAGLSLAVALAGCAAGEDLLSDRKDSGARANTGGGFGNGAGGSGGSGFLGAGGSSGTGGSSNGGSSGTGGSTGQGGASGTGGGFTGAGGSAGSRFLGNGGSPPSDGGSAGGGNLSDGPVSTGLLVQTRPDGGATVLQFTAVITNTGLDTLMLGDLKLRYYFTDESFIVDPTTVASAVNFDAGAWQGSVPPYYMDYKATCTAALSPVTPKKTGADWYFEIGCQGSPGLVLAPSDIEKIQFRLQGPFEDPTNDYSYLPADGGNTLVTNDHVLLLQSGALAWGVEP